MKSGKKVLAIGICMVLAIGVIACSVRKEPQGISSEDIGISNTENTQKPESKPQADEPQTDEPQTDEPRTQENVPQDNQTQNSKENNAEPQATSKDNSQDSSSLFANANLQGSVVEFSDTEISISMATTETTDHGGEVMAEAAPGMENMDELVYITYKDDTVIQLLVMDSASLTQVSLSDSEKSSIKKQTSVLVFGSCQDTYHWTADKVVIVRWQ